jgi:hypothetical protein
MTLWPDVMHQLAMLSGMLLGVKSEAAVAVFATFRNARVRHDAILAAAEFALNARDLELLNAILTVIASAEKERDNLAHGCYGVSTAIEDGILWVETRHVGPWNVSMLLKEPHRSEKNTRNLLNTFSCIDTLTLEAVYQEIHDCWRAAFDFLGYIRQPSAQGYHQLCKLPRVASALDQIRKGTKNTP